MKMKKKRKKKRRETKFVLLHLKGFLPKESRPSFFSWMASLS